MPKAPSISLTKLIEATKLHPRTGLSLGLPPVTVPYGALVEPVSAERDRQRFTYLADLYECERELFLSATGGSKSAAAEEAAAAPAPEPEPVEPVERVEPEPVEPELEASGPPLEWERLNSGKYTVNRAAIPGGWLVALHGNGVAFVPDSRHQWDGGSIE